MDSRILATLANWTEATGWDLWADDEGVADQLGLPRAVSGPDYEKFKRAVVRLEERGLIYKKVENRRIARATWTITAAGKAEAKRPVDPDVDVQSYIGKRIRGSVAVPRDVWRDLMGRHRAGELDLAFLPRKNDGD